MRNFAALKPFAFILFICALYSNKGSAYTCSEALNSNPYPLGFRVYQEEYGGGPLSLLGSPFPLGTPHDDPRRLAYEEKEAQKASEKAKLKKRLTRFDRVLRNKFLKDRSAWIKLEASIKEPAPYTFDDLIQRRIPIYYYFWDAPDEVKRHYHSISSEEDRRSISELFLRDFEFGVDIASCEPNRFPKTLPKSEILETIRSNSTARERVLNPSLKQGVSYNFFEISRVSPNKVVFNVDPKYVNAKVRSFATKFNNYLHKEDLRLVEVDGIPMMAGKALEVQDGKPIWTNEIALRAKTWNALHPFFPFSIGRTSNGEYRQLYPLFKPFSLLNDDVLPEDGGYRIMKKLEQFSHAFSYDSRSLVGFPLIKGSLGLKLQDLYLAGDFGPHRFGIPFIGFENLGFRTEKSYRTLSDEPVFKLSNVLFAQMLTTADVNRRVFFVFFYVDGNNLRDWFEVIYWLHNPQIWIHQYPTGERLVPYGQFFTEEKATVLASNWITQKSLKKHFKKHGGPDEMDIDSVNDYLSAAIDFFESDEKAQIMMKKDRSDRIMKYNFRTKEFGVVNTSGQIITYYRLTEAYRSSDDFHEYIGNDYWMRD